MNHDEISLHKLEALNPAVLNVLRCPTCGGDLDHTQLNIPCNRCGMQYGPTNGTLDLRPRRAVNKALEVPVGTLPDALMRFDTVPRLSLNPDVEIDYENIEAPKHVSKAMLSHFKKASSPTDLGLDIGCGDCVHRKLLEQCGYTYVGIDYDTRGAPILGDAHSLPLETESISFGISIAVLEHLYSPLIALREVWRVLKPGARFVGSVAFLEPFHDGSFFHHSHRGLIYNLVTAGFDIRHVATEGSWTAPVSLQNSLFYGVPRSVAQQLCWPINTLSRLTWALGDQRKPGLSDRRSRDLAGAFVFVAEKPA